MSVETLRGDAQALHHREIEPVAIAERLVVVRPAVVLGSTQSTDLVDLEQARQAGFDVVHRRSGGGVVVLQPDDHVWIDVTVPRGHALWVDDVERATWWLGNVWRDELQQVDPAGEWSVHREKLVADPVERSVCFAAVGPGEVVNGVRKVVGISQRRTKDAARFQCTVFRSVDVASYRKLLRVDVPAALEHALGVGDELEALSQRVQMRLVEDLLSNAGR